MGMQLTGQIRAPELQTIPSDGASTSNQVATPKRQAVGSGGKSGSGGTPITPRDEASTPESAVYSVLRLLSPHLMEYLGIQTLTLLSSPHGYHNLIIEQLSCFFLDHCSLLSPDAPPHQCPPPLHSRIRLHKRHGTAPIVLHCNQPAFVEYAVRKFQHFSPPAFHLIPNCCKSSAILPRKTLFLVFAQVSAVTVPHLWSPDDCFY